MGQEQKPHKLNVDGQFYVVNECCTACGVPESIAPEMFTYDAQTNCYVRHQPTSTAELERALQVLRTQELGCIRYRGTDADVLRRLAEIGAAELCDHPIDGVEPVLRNLVMFVPAGENDQSVDYLGEFVHYLQNQRPDESIRTKRSFFNRAVLSICWFESKFHRLTIRRDLHCVVIEHDGPLAISEWLHDWLLTTRQSHQIQWYTKADWQDGRTGQNRPW